MGNQKKTIKNGISIRYLNHMDTNTWTKVFQINLLNFASQTMLLYTLSRGLNVTLPMGLDLTKFGTLPRWTTNLPM